MNLFAILDQTATRHADEPALFKGTTQVATWRELRDRALRLAGGLEAKFGRGDRIAIYSENCSEFIEIMFGTWAASMVLTPINAKLHPNEVIDILEDSDAAAVFVSPKAASGVRSRVSTAVQVIEIGSVEYHAMLEAAMQNPIDPDPTALAWLFFTSGTTGRSKGAMLSHRNILAMSIAHLADIEAIDEQSSIIHAAPMSHGSGLYAPAYVMRGARQVVPDSRGFDCQEFLNLCEYHPGVGAFFAPTMVQRLRLHVTASGERPENLRCIVYGGGPMYVEEMRKSLAVFGPIFAQIYGQGETPMTITALRASDHIDANDDVLGSVGYVRSGVEVAVVGEDGEPLTAGDVGEIICRSDIVMAGYWNNPSATAEALREGWLYTGDIGSMSENGLLTLRDRSKDVVISGGTNVYPREVEEALLKHPAVLEVCVLGERDDEWGEIVVAVIVPVAGATLSSADLDAHCNDLIARFKRPKKYIFSDSLPKNAYGKVLKRDLRLNQPESNSTTRIKI